MGELTEEDVRAIARYEAERTLTERTIPDFPAYFIGDKWLLTYEWHAAAWHDCREQIRALEQRVAALEQPWWKRLFKGRINR